MYMCVHVCCDVVHVNMPAALHILFMLLFRSGTLPVSLLLLFTIVSHIIISNIFRLSNPIYSPLVFFKDWARHSDNFSDVRLREAWRGGAHFLVVVTKF